MTSHQAKLVQESFGQVTTLPAELVGSLVYDRLFSITPDVKPLFSRTTTLEQSRKLLARLAYVVARLDRPDQLVNDLEQLALRHVRYGVRDRQYDQMGDALRWTLEQGLSEAWTQSVKGAWVACHTLLSEVMLRATSKLTVDV